MRFTNKYNLPAFAIADELNRLLLQHTCVVVTAPPGAGKSTLLPLTVLNETSEGKVIVLEPRRLAARQIATRMAEMLGEEVGRTVGYRVRMESRVGRETRIEVVTEGILTRMLIDDPTLDGVSVVIFDEFHERNIHSDVALALTREAQSVIRPDLKLVVMSATIDTAEICQKLAAPLLESEGRMFPVEILRASADTEQRSVAEDVARCIVRAHCEHEGDILAFLPGQTDIERCRELLGDSLGATIVCPLYGQLTPSEQRKAIAPSAEGERKVVLATNIAETSLTIEGVRVVIDSGYHRKMVYDSRSGLSHLETVRISMDMANQRSGRAGRVAPGVCYRLWTLATEHRMAVSRTPEILEADLTPMALDLSVWTGCLDVAALQRLPWMTVPPKARLYSAIQLLQMLGAVNDDGQLNDHGRRLAALPCHPRMAQMLVVAESSEQKALAADIAAVLEEKDPMAATDDCDMNLRIVALRDARRNRLLKRWGRIECIAAQYRRMVRANEDNSPVDVNDVGRLIALAYPERIARVAALGRVRMASGEEATLPPSSELEACSWIAVANVHAGGRVFLASPLNIADIEALIYERENVAWDSRQGMVVAQRERRVGLLTVDVKPLNDVPMDMVHEVLCEAAKKEGKTMFDFDEKVRNLQQRIATVAAWRPELNLPIVETESFLQNAERWLPFFVGKASTVAELRKTDIAEAVWSLLTYDQQQEVDRLAPTHLQVPTGSRVRVEYRTGAECPILRVRLQECFGWTDTPLVNDGHCKVLMELLSPGFKPVQLTQDLASFWQSTYFEVRKELKRRYPKHYWPDNPLEAEPVRGTKRKK